MNRSTVAGQLFVFEGPDGVGKSTVSSTVLSQLRQNGLDVELLTFPGRAVGTLGKVVYDIHHGPEQFNLASLSQASKQALHIAAHLDAIERLILPLLRNGTNVLLDRYWWSTWVYGVVDGIDKGILEALIGAERIAWGSVKPATVFLIRRKSPINRQDEPLGRWKNLVREYDALADAEGRRHSVSILDNSTSLANTVASSLDHIKNKLLNSSRAPRPSVQNSLTFAQVPEPTEGSGPTILTHLLPVRPTVVFNTYWKFAAERQRIFYERAKGEPGPWTADPILRAHKFTNAYRASDRVSQFLIRNVIYRKDLPSDSREVFFRIMLFKLFNKISTWEMLEQSFGAITYEAFSFKQYDKVLSDAMARGESIYSAAYIMPSGGSQLGHEKKHRNHLALIELMMKDQAYDRLSSAGSMQKAFTLLRDYPTLGDFLAYQYATDINYSEITNFSEMDFVIPGPGALDGIRKCFADPGGLNEPELIKFVADQQEREFQRLDLDFLSLWGRRLQLIDCQNLFCEVDKYARVYHPEVAGVSGRTRIKQKFSPLLSPIQYFYPPKWNLNHLIQSAPTLPPVTPPNIQGSFL